MLSAFGIVDWGVKESGMQQSVGKVVEEDTVYELRISYFTYDASQNGQHEISQKHISKPHPL